MTRCAGAGRGAALALLLALLPAAAGAQWSVDASAGRAVYAPSIEHFGAVSASLGVRYSADSGRWLYLAGGTDVVEDGPVWAAGGAGGWLGVERGAVSLGARLSGQAFAYAVPGGVTLELPEDTLQGGGGTGGTVEVIPTLLLRRGTVEAELHSGVVQTLELFPGPGYLARLAFDGGAKVSLDPAPGVRVSGRGRYLHLPEGGFPYVGATAEVERRWGSAWASTGWWLRSDFLSDGTSTQPYPGVGVGATARVGRVEVLGAWQQEAGDPLYLSSPRRSWTVRVSHVLGPRRRAAAAPASLEPPPAAPGQAVVRLSVAEHPGAPFVLGDFTGWEPVEMTRAGEFWEARLPAAPGVYRYGFRTAGGEWFVPASLPQADDGMGGKSAVLVVAGPQAGGM